MDKPMTGTEIDAMLAKMRADIDALDRFEMAQLWRYGPSSHPYFQPPLGDYFKKRFYEDLRGFSPEISKSLGWEKPR